MDHRRAEAEGPKRTEERLRPERGAKPPSESAWGRPPPLVAEQVGDQLWRGLAVARMDYRRAEAEGPKRTEERLRPERGAKPPSESRLGAGPQAH